MEPRQRALTGLIIAQIIVSALALMLRSAEAPSLRVESEGVVFGISTINYLLSVASLIVALTLLAGGMLYAHVIGRWLFLLSLASLYLLVVLGLSHDNADHKIGVLSAVFGMPLAMLAAADMPASYKSHYSPERQQPWIYRSAQVIFYLWAAGFLAAFIAVCLHPIGYADLLVIIRSPLPYLFLLAGTDWAEIDDSLVRLVCIWFSNGRSLNTLKTVIIAVCLISMIIMYWICRLQVLSFLPIAVVATGLLYLVMRNARPVEHWPIGFPWAALAVVVIGMAVAMDLVGQTREGALALPVVTLSGFAIALVWWRRRQPQSRMVPILLFGVVQSVVLLCLVAPIPDVTQRFAAMIFWVAAASLMGFVWLTRRRQNGEELSEPLRLLLVLNVSLLALYGLFAGVFEFARNMGDHADIVFAFVMFVALVWDILVSGHTITNIDGGLYPRRSRLLLFFAYVTLVVATVEFFGSVRPIEAPSYIEEAMKVLGDPELFVQRGIALFGPA